MTTRASFSGLEADGDHLGHADARLRGHQRRDCLVLDLLEPSHRCAPRWVTVGEQSPATGQPLGVLRVPAEHAHLQRAPLRVVPHELGRSDPLSLRDAQVVDGRHRATASAVRTSSIGGTPAADPKREPDKRTGGKADRQGSEDLGRQAAPRTTAPTAARPTSQPASTRTGRTSSGPATAITATTPASRSSGKPQLEKT